MAKFVATNYFFEEDQILLVATILVSKCGDKPFLPPHFAPTI